MDFIGEILGGLVSAAAGFLIGSIVFLVVRLSRWALMGTERSTQVTDRQGSVWTVRIPLAPSPMRFWASQRLLRMRPNDRRRRETEGTSADGVTTSELAHPVALVGKTDEAASIVAIVMLAFVLLALVVFVLEAVLVLLVAIVVAVMRLIGGHWQCEVVSPDGHTERVGAGSLGDARARRAELEALIEAGTYRQAERVFPSTPSRRETLG